MPRTCVIPDVMWLLAFVRGASWNKALAAGLNVATIEDASRDADVVMMLVPDENIARVYSEQVEPNRRMGQRFPCLCPRVQCGTMVRLCRVRILM